VIPLDIGAPERAGRPRGRDREVPGLRPEQPVGGARAICATAGARHTDAAGAIVPLSVVRQRLRPKRANVEQSSTRRGDAGSSRDRHSCASSRCILRLVEPTCRFALRTLRKTARVHRGHRTHTRDRAGRDDRGVQRGGSARPAQPASGEPDVPRDSPESREGPNQSSDMGASTFRYDRYLVFKDAASSVFTGVAAQHIGSFDVRTGNETRAMWGQLTSGNYWDVLGVRPALGRFYTADEDTPAAGEPVVVLGNDFWRRLGVTPRSSASRWLWRVAR
jgi:hypothetical protein